MSNEYKKCILPGITGKVVVVTGGSGGIGKAISLKMGELGAKVAIIDIDKKSGEKTVDNIRNNGGIAIFYEGDVSNEESINNCMQKIYNKFRGIDILVNNAGITNSTSFEELTIKEWLRIININLTGVYICSKAAIKFILASKGKAIVMVSSGSALTGSGGGVHYAASKGGVNSFIRALSRELAPKGIRVNGVAPRSIDSDQLKRLYSEEERLTIKKKIPIGRLGECEEVASVVAFLSSDLSSFITGEVILVDGGRTFCK